MAIGHQSFYQAQLTANISDTDLNIPLDVVPTPSEGFLVIESTVASKREIIYYTSKTANSVVVPSGAGNGRGYDGTTATSHLQGAAVIMAPVGAMFEKLGDIEVNSINISGSASSEGWSPTGSTLTYVSNDGDKQATYKFTGEDKTNTIQEGMKVKLPRTTTVGSQCADFEVSSSQYASRASGSVTGCTFTDDFTCGAWVKLESYGNGTDEQAVISRYSGGVGGFILRIAPTGALRTVIGNAANTDEVGTYQSIPLGEWVHIAMGLDFSTDTFTAYINGTDVATYQVDVHSLSALVQSGALHLGSFGTGADYFDGKIKHAFVANKVLSEAEVQEAMVSDELESSSFSANLVAYYKLEGNFNDSSGNGNNLTANAGVVATNVDSPFSSTEYGVITSATFSTDTTVTIDFGRKVPVNENVTAPAYSTHNVPYGFPINVAEQQREQVDGVWQDWGPTFTNISGSGLQYAKYTKIGNTIHFKLFYVCSGADVSGASSFTLPVAAAEGQGRVWLGSGFASTSGGGFQMLFASLNSTTAATIFAATASGTYVSTANTSATVPITWAANSSFGLSGYYEAA